SQLGQPLAFEAMRLRGNPTRLGRALLSSEAFQRILQAAGRTETVAELVAACDGGKPRSFDLGVRAHFRAENPVRELTSFNVVGVAPGHATPPFPGEGGRYGAAPGPTGHRQA